MNYLEEFDYGIIEIDDFKVDFKLISKDDILILCCKLVMVF